MRWRKSWLAGLALLAVGPATLQAGVTFVPSTQPPGYSIPPPGFRQPYGYYSPYGGFGYPSYYGGFFGGVVYVVPPPPVVVVTPPLEAAQPAAVAMPAPMPAELPPPDPHVAQITLTVPADAQVWIQGVKSAQGGTTRRFVSPQLDAGKTYHYDFRISYGAKGKETTQIEKVEIHAGDRKSLVVVSPPAAEALPPPR